MIGFLKDERVSVKNEPMFIFMLRDGSLLLSALRVSVIEIPIRHSNLDPFVAIFAIYCSYFGSSTPT